jgi:hypothetical protein
MKKTLYRIKRGKAYKVFFDIRINGYFYKGASARESSRQQGLIMIIFPGDSKGGWIGIWLETPMPICLDNIDESTLISVCPLMNTMLLSTSPTDEYNKPDARVSQRSASQSLRCIRITSHNSNARAFIKAASRWPV